MDTNRQATVDAALKAAAARIDAVDARWLLLHVLQRSPVWLLAHGDEAFDTGAAAQFDALVSRRAAGEPVAYLTGRRGFWSLELTVDAAVLIPRPDTELLVTLALARMPEQAALQVADLGTGSGAIALALAHERPAARLVATDASAAALAVAQANASRLGAATITFRLGHWCEPLHGERFDMIVSNPPYIAAADPHLSQGDLRFEPVTALASGHDGLDAIRTITRDAPTHLHDGGWLLIEHGWDQGAAVRALFSAAGFTEVATHRDLEDRDRITCGRRMLPAHG